MHSDRKEVPSKKIKSAVSEFSGRMKIPTERLLLYPLTLEELVSLGNGNTIWIGQTEIIPPSEPNVIRAYSIKIKKIASAPDSLLFCTYWVAIEKTTGNAIGEAGFKGPPDKDGFTEVGYGVFEGFEGRGFMTETVCALTRWAFENHSDVLKTIIAVTDADNIGSRRVLEKAGFKFASTSVDQHLWKLKKNDIL